MKWNSVRFETLSGACMGILDGLMVCGLVYLFYKLVQGSTAVKVIVGFFFMYLLYIVAQRFKLTGVQWALGKFVNVGLTVPVVLFQREIRYFLFRIGKGVGASKSTMLYVLPWFRVKQKGFNLNPIVKAVQILGGSNTGALIVFTQDADLKYYEETGDRIHAMISSRLLIAIFNKQSPLHDGAVIIHKNKIIAARCVLPVSDNPNISAQFGLRHKAAIGLTEVTDTLVLVVSEETGQISIAKQGKLTTNFSIQEVRSILKDYYE